MYIKIRKLGAKPEEDDIKIEISRKAKIQELRTMIFEESGIEVDKQRLFYKGKQLIDDHDLYEYGVHLNEVIQLMVRSDVAPILDEENKDESKAGASKDEPHIGIDVQSKYYLVGDRIDMRDLHGAWFEAKINQIIKNETQETAKVESEIIFRCIRESDTDQPTLELTFDDIRPRAYHTYKRTVLKPGMLVMVNHNIDEPKERGYWYDFRITHSSNNKLKGTLFFGKDKTPLEAVACKFADEVLRIEKPDLLEEREIIEKLNDLPMRKIPFNCLKCKDEADVKCKGCGCKVCYGKNNYENILLCDECDAGYHIGCLTPPLKQVPAEDEWYCPNCKTDENEIVKAGDKLKFSKKKASMPSGKEDKTTRDWGKGMACLGRTKECTLVSKNHLGPIPGVDVGTCWKYRIQVSEAGIHRPLVAGIHGRESDYAYSIVLSGGYEDDIDNGNEFFYTGSGGRDLSGNKRVSEQSSNQLLTRMNKALANNCYAKYNPKDGAESDDWKRGKPIRVVRNCKAAKHSKYAPKEGNRYDGIYKMVKYYPETGKSGFIVWRYLLRRDDPNPAPWEEGGQEFEMLYPDGYLEAQQKKNEANATTSKRGTKRVLADSSNTQTPKKSKSETYKVPEDINEKIAKDMDNAKIWSECNDVLSEGKVKYLAKVEELFMCICCQEVVFLPITTECRHNICKTCLRRSFSSDIHTCPSCRFDLGKDYQFIVNSILGEILLSLFPGYGNCR